MDSEERKLLIQIYKDCIKLKKRKELTEFGRGQLIICELLLRKEKFEA